MHPVLREVSQELELYIVLHPAQSNLIRDLFYGFNQRDREEIPRQHKAAAPCRQSRDRAQQGLSLLKPCEMGTIHHQQPQHLVNSE